MSTYTGVTNFQKQSGFFGPPCIWDRVPHLETEQNCKKTDHVQFQTVLSCRCRRYELGISGRTLLNTTFYNSLYLVIISSSTQSTVEADIVFGPVRLCVSVCTVTEKLRSGSWHSLIGIHVTKWFYFGDIWPWLRPWERQWQCTG